MIAVSVLLAPGVIAPASPVAASNPGCKGMNWVGNETGESLVQGRLVVAMDTCEAGALAAKLRTQADQLQSCVNVTGLAGAVMSFFLGTGRIFVYGGAITGVTVAGTCNESQTKLRTWAGKITEWTARCGDLGIKFRMSVLPDQKILFIRDFVCQNETLPEWLGSYNSTSYDPTPEDLDYTNGQDYEEMSLVTLPRGDEGGTCSSDPYYFSDVRLDEGIENYSLYRPEGNDTWTELRWNWATGDYDLVIGPASQDCGPPPLPNLPPEVPQPDGWGDTGFDSGVQCQTSVVIEYFYGQGYGTKDVLTNVYTNPEFPELYLWQYDRFFWDVNSPGWQFAYSQQADGRSVTCGSNSGPTG